jgi:hypothetical protein
VVEAEVAAVMTMMMTIMAVQVAEVVVAAVTTMMMTIVAVQVAEAVAAAVMTTTITMVADKTPATKNEMHMDVLRLKHQVLKNKGGSLPPLFLSLNYLLGERL